MRRLLDAIYFLSAALAGIAILAICVLVSAQVGFNILARIGGASLSYTIPSYADFSGYFLATASFMALAYTLRSGGHIRVGLLVQNLPERWRWIAELTTLGSAALFSAFATYYTLNLIGDSWRFGDKSTGIVAIPIWVPQCFMVAGLGLLTIAFIDTFIESLRAKSPILSDAGAE